MRKNGKFYENGKEIGTYATREDGYMSIHAGVFHLEAVKESMVDYLCERLGWTAVEG